MWILFVFTVDNSKMWSNIMYKAVFRHDLGKMSAELGPVCLSHVDNAAWGPRLRHVHNNTVFRWGGAQQAEAGTNTFIILRSSHVFVYSTTPALALITESSLDVLVCVLDVYCSAVSTWDIHIPFCSFHFIVCCMFDINNPAEDLFSHMGKFCWVLKCSQFLCEWDNPLFPWVSCAALHSQGPMKRGKQC